MAEIVSHAANKQYRDNYDRVFNKDSADTCQACQEQYDDCSCDEFVPTYVWIVHSEAFGEIRGVYFSEARALEEATVNGYTYTVIKMEVMP